MPLPLTLPLIAIGAAVTIGCGYTALLEKFNNKQPSQTVATSSNKKALLQDKTERLEKLFKNMNLLDPKKGEWVKCVDYVVEPCYRVVKLSISDNLFVNNFIKNQETICQKLNGVNNLEIFHLQEDGYMCLRTLENEMPPVEFELSATNPFLVPIGVSIDNEVVYWDMKADPHGIIVGTTGCGKTSLVHMIINHLIVNLQCPPMFLIDLKKGAEFARYENIRNVIGYAEELDSAKQVIAQVNAYAEARYDYLKSKGYSNYYEYIEEHPEDISCCQFYFIVDEFADLMSLPKKKNEIPPIEILVGISRKIRAAGGHLLIATQKPTADSIPPTLKANCSFVAGFKVINAHNSRIVLEEEGLELLPPRHAICLLNGNKVRMRTMQYNKETGRQVIATNRMTIEEEIEKEDQQTIAKEDVLDY